MELNPDISLFYNNCKRFMLSRQSLQQPQKRSGQLPEISTTPMPGEPILFYPMFNSWRSCLERLSSPFVGVLSEMER